MVRATWKLYAYLSGSWYDLTNDVDAPTNNVLGNTEAERGISGNGPLDFVADTGTLSFDLNNYAVEGKYTYGHPNALAGWKKGVKIKQVFTYDGRDYIEFKGVVNSITDAGAKAERKHVMCVDWMEYAAEHSIDNPGILANQTGDQVLDTTLGLMPIPPEATEFDTGINTFPTAFDTVTSKTTALDEMVKVALSEISSIYLRADRTYGETLVFENARARNGFRELTPFMVPSSDAGFLLKADGGKVLTADGGRLLLNTTQTLDLNDNTSVLDYDTEDGENVLNRFAVYVVPRRKDTTAKVLFQLDAPIEIASGDTITIKGTYANPDGGLPVNVNPSDMITPAATTDYRAFVNDDGTGTEFTADLTVTPDYGTNGFEHEVFNGSANTGFITLFNCRGLGVYTYNQISTVAKDIDSQNEFGVRAESLTQKYKHNLSYGRIYANKVVDEERDQRIVLNKTFMSANKIATMMQAFLCLDIGDLVRIRRDKDNIDAYYFIQSKSYRTMPGGLTMFDWGVKEFLTLVKGLSTLGIEFRGGSFTDGINYGNLPALVNLPSKSMGAWIYLDAAPVATSDVVMGTFSDTVGYLISVTTDRRVQFYEKSKTGVTPFNGVWKSPVNSVPVTTWCHVFVTYAVGSDPIIYIDEVSQTLTNDSAGGTELKNEVGAITVIGNWKTATENFTRSFDGKIFDPRVYNRIVTQAEVTSLHDAGLAGGPLTLRTPDSGLVFQPFAVPTKRLSSYTNASLASDMKLWDSINFAIGTPVGSPIGRLV